MTRKITRRTFTQASAAATLGWATLASAAPRVLGANDRIRLGFIGVANRGGQLMTAFLKHSDMEIVALCDVSGSTLEQARARLDHPVETYADFRRVLDRPDIDAVVIATPDHWHAIQTIQACRAGKDVYIEKPLAATVVEGRKMVEAARRHSRVVQVGMQRRSSTLYAEVGKMIAADTLGRVTIGRGYHQSNMAPRGIGHEKPIAPPADLDWNLWLGPREERPYQANITPYKFRWWGQYSSQIANQGVHALDVLRWLRGDQAPRSISAMGGKFAVDDDRTIPDTLETVFEFASGWLAIFGQYEASGNPVLPKGYLELRGTKGTAYLTDKACEVLPERGGQFQDSAPRMSPMKVEGTDGDLTVQHARNFLDCMRSRALPNADVEEGHRSTTMSLLANISLATSSRIEWDAQAEKILSPASANDLLHYEYRKPWTLEE